MKMTPSVWQRLSIPHKHVRGISFQWRWRHQYERDRVSRINMFKGFRFNADDAISMKEIEYSRIKLFEGYRFNEDDAISMKDWRHQYERDWVFPHKHVVWLKFVQNRLSTNFTSTSTPPTIPKLYRGEKHLVLTYVIITLFLFSTVHQLRRLCLNYHHVHIIVCAMRGNLF